MAVLLVKWELVTHLMVMVVLGMMKMLVYLSLAVALATVTVRYDDGYFDRSHGHLEAAVELEA